MTIAVPPVPGAALSGDTERAAYLLRMCGLLWPSPASITVTATKSARPGRSGPGDGEFFVIPSQARPRLLVPAPPRAASAAVRRYGEQASRRARIRTQALSLVLASGLGPAFLRGRLSVRAPEGADTIEAYLRGTLGTGIRVSMHLGPARANRKPVLQLLTPRGQTLGFAKIGISPLTSGLVRAEHAALGRLARAGLTSLATPPVLHYGQWQGLDVLVLGALPVWQRRRALPPARLAAAMAEVAGVGGRQEGPLASTQYWQVLRQRLATADEGADRGALLAALDSLGATAGQTVLSYGCWHGDWTPWNMANVRSGLLVWDWERFTSGVPAGFDALHYWLQNAVVPEHQEPRTAAAGCLNAAPRLLAPLGAGPVEARITALLYLADLATRYLVDRQADAGARLGNPGQWLIPAITAGLARR